MNSFDSAFEKVCRLVDDFKENENHYLSPKYNEQQARKDYIDRLFIALGWDVNHTEQRNPYRQEVKVEETQINQRRPDYTFYIEPKFKEPKFFVEAKKPSRNLKDAMFYYQTIRYARFASTSVAVLTDFEEFHILDCRFKPDINTVLKNTNHKVFHYTDYADKEKFEKIYYLFSREEVSKNSLQDYSDSLPKLKIKGVQAAVLKLEQQSLDEEFLVYLDNVREKLAKAFKKNDLNLTSDELTEATQRTIDRLVFIRFLEDKLIEDDDYVSKLGLSKNSWADFISICKTLNSKYNGIVFKEHFIDSQRFSGPELSGFADICLDFSQRNPNGYNYNLIPIHILGSIYERFLGKVVIATDKRVRIDEKPEVRKAGGVYYTPKYIVDYIVDNTVGKILRNETGDCHSCESRNPVKGKTPKEITKLRFADIACGSGSFLIGVFETLLEYHNNYYWNHHDEAKADGCLFKDGAPVLNIRQKQNILLNNIYGVDIDHQAVEVTQLSLALKMLEDETLATANEMQVLFHEKILPDLTKNIVCGNSLIGTDILEGKMFPSEEERKLNPMDFEKRFPHIFCHSGESRNPDNNGFDAIVGNPPYVFGRDWKSLGITDNVKHYLSNHFKASPYQLDMFSVFMEKAFRDTNLNGFVGMIVPNVWLTNTYSSLTRKFILENTSTLEILVSDNKVFKNLTVDVIVFISHKGGLKSNDIIINKYSGNRINYVSSLPYKKYEGGKEPISTSLDNRLQKIIDKIRFNKKELYYFANITRGVHPYRLGGYGKSAFTKGFQIEKDILERPYHSQEFKKGYRPFIYGKDLKRYLPPDANEFIHYGDWLAEPRASKFFEGDRIYSRKILGDRLVVTIEKSNSIADQQVYITLPINNEIGVEYLSAIMGSKLISFYIKNYFDEVHDAFPQIKVSQLKSLPIKEVDKNNLTDTEIINKLRKWVNNLIESKKQISNAKTEKDRIYYENKCADLDNAIDVEVYKLYGLTEDEVKIVEGIV